MINSGNLCPLGYKCYTGGNTPVCYLTCNGKGASLGNPPCAAGTVETFGDCCAANRVMQNPYISSYQPPYQQPYQQSYQQSYQPYSNMRGYYNGIFFMKWFIQSRLVRTVITSVSKVPATSPPLACGIFFF